MYAIELNGTLYAHIQARSAAHALRKFKRLSLGSGYYIRRGKILCYGCRDLIQYTAHPCH